MKFAKGQTALPQFHMTAMMDVIFLLLCFFITSTVFSQWESEVDITLPTAKSAHALTRDSSEVMLNVTRDGVVIVNQRTFEGPALEQLLAQIASYLPGQPVIIRGDKETRYESLMAVLDACRMAGISQISFATDSAQEKSSK